MEIADAVDGAVVVQRENAAIAAFLSVSPGEMELFTPERLRREPRGFRGCIWGRRLVVLRGRPAAVPKQNTTGQQGDDDNGRHRQP